MITKTGGDFIYNDRRVLQVWRPNYTQLSTSQEPGINANTPGEHGIRSSSQVDNMRRNALQKWKDFITFPVRALTLFHSDRCGLSCLSSERFDYVAGEVRDYCLDVGCGRHNRFILEYLNGNGKGIDVFPYEGLSPEHLVADITHFPFGDCNFDSVTFIANLNHVPRSQRNTELAEAFRCLKPGGNVIVTMGNPIAELLVHQIVYIYDRFFRTNVDMDSERGMGDEEEYYLTDSEILRRLSEVGFKNVRKKYFWTQWGLNHLFVGWK
jgi:SAM-dependent methyltransferase